MFMWSNKMRTDELSQYEYLWTTARDHHRLITIDYHGQVQYLIYNVPTKTVIVLKKLSLEKQVIRQMLNCGVPVVDDCLLETADRNAAVH
jgi:hypothetical protein